MENSNQTSVAEQAADARQFNYFHYFSEIEETFVRRRGKHLLVGTMDWALMEAWKEMGVPLHVVLRGIERSFDSYESKPRKRSVKTLMYCQEEVEAQFAEWKEMQLGAAQKAEDESESDEAGKHESDAGLPFSRASIVEHLSRVRTALAELSERYQSAGKFSESLARVINRLEDLEKDFGCAARPDAERLEESLTDLERMLDEALRASISAAEMAKAIAETEAQLQPYKSRMEQETYRQTLDNLLLKRLREQACVPRLSLFYL